MMDWLVILVGNPFTFWFCSGLSKYFDYDLLYISTHSTTRKIRTGGVNLSHYPVTIQSGLEASPVWGKYVVQVLSRPLVPHTRDILLSSPSRRTRAKS